MKVRSIRFRLTAFVSILFACALLITGLVVRQQLQRSLEGSAQDDVAAALEDLLSAGVVGEPVSDLTRVVYFDENGREITPNEFEELLRNLEAAAFDVPVGEDRRLLGPGFLETDPAFGSVVFPSTHVFPDFVEVVGSPAAIDLGPGSVAFATPVEVGGLELAVGVSAPREPIENVIRTVSTAGAVLVPILTALVAAMTWMTTSRALRPVEVMRRQVDQTHLGRLDVRVPKMGTSDEIDRLAGTMNDMLDRLDRAAEQQRRFISDASHELRSPITATLATIETSTIDNIDEWDEMASLIGREQYRLADLVDDLLLLAQLDEAGVHSMEDVDLDDLAIEESERPHPCAVSVEIRDACRVTASPRLLRRCLSNLVDNATRHAASAVSITVGVTAAGEARIRVDDDGPGVPSDRRDEIFQRFTRLDESRRANSGGAGLGLAISHDIAAQHQASLTVADSPLGGARFELRFPTV